MTDDRRSLSAEDAEEYTAALGQVVAGGYRQVALGVRLGVPQALGLTVGDWVEHRLGGYVRLSIPERRAAVAELTADGLTQREVAEVLGVGEATVSRDAHVSTGSNGDGHQQPDADDLPTGTEAPPAVKELEPSPLSDAEADALTRNHAAEDAELAALEHRHAYLAELNGVRRLVADIAARMPTTYSDDGWLLAVRSAAEDIARIAESIPPRLLEPIADNVRRIR